MFVLSLPALLSQPQEVRRIASITEFEEEDLWALDNPSFIVDFCTAEIGKKNQPLGVLSKLYHARGDAFSRLRDFEKARRDYEELLRIMPFDNKCRQRLAHTLFVLGFQAEAIALYDKLIKDSPDYYSAYAPFAAILLQRGDLGRALELVNKAINRAPDCAMPYYIRAHVLFATRAYRQCVADLDVFITKEPVSYQITDVSDPYTLRGFALVKIGSIHSAAMNFLFVRRMDRDNYDASKGMWQVYSLSQRHALAAAMAGSMARIRPRALDTYLACVESFAAVGKMQASKEAQQNALALADKNPDVHWKIGLAYCHMRRYKEAIQSFDKAILLDKRHVGALISKAELLVGCPDSSVRDGRAALDSMKTILKEEESNSAEATLQMGMAYAELKEFDQAVRCVRSAAKTLKATCNDHYLLPKCGKLLVEFEKRKPFRLGESYGAGP
jgi:tetratricopeptide (TPR) repeat protein